MNVMNANSESEFTKWMQKRNACVRKAVWENDGAYFREFMISSMTEKDKERYLELPMEAQLEISLRTACKICFNIRSFGSGDRLRASEIIKSMGGSPEISFEEEPEEPNESDNS